MLAKEGFSVSNYKNDCLKYRLRKKFGEQLTFFRSSKRVTEPEMVTSPSVPQSLLLEHVAETIAINDDHDEIVEVSDDSLDPIVASGENTGTSAAQSGYDTDVLLELFHSALYLRKVLLGMKNTLTHANHC